MDESRTAALGRYGEQLAAEHLTAAGMTVLARNWRCAEGELDLVLQLDLGHKSSASAS